MKICTKCGCEKILEDFGSAPSLKSGRHSWCKTCLKDRVWESKLKSHYNLTLTDYNELLDSQNGACAICGLEPTSRRLAVDHDHACCPGEKSCGKCVRGLLCTNCNLGIGAAQDNIAILEAMIIYLRGNIELL
jgi:hypothetical protein